MTPFGPLAITADGYGLTEGISEGIARLARTQAITGVSVMCHPAARLERLEILKNSGVLTGVHLVLVEERPVLADDPGLKPILDRRGRFPDSWMRLFFLVMLKPWVLPALKREVEAQINRFVELGLSLDFINSHQHVHLFPPIWLTLRPLLESYKVPIRGTAHWDWQGWSPQGWINAISWISWHLGCRMGNSLSLKPVGINATGRFSMATAKELLTGKQNFSRWEVPELVVHPGCEDRQARDYYSHWKYQWDQERTTLASEPLQTLLEQNGCDLLGASMKIRERVAEAGTFATRTKSSEVVLAMVWPQTWEQVVLFTRLTEGLVRKGSSPHQLLPDLLFGLERHQFEHYRGFSLGRRLIDLWFWLRSLGQRIDNTEALLHLVVPSPAWAWVAGLIGFPGERVLLHYSGRAVAWDAANGKAFLTDPWFVGPAMLANPEFIALLAGRVAAAHLTMDAGTARILTRVGCKRVFQCPGLVELPGGSKGRSETKTRNTSDASAIYVGFSGSGSPVEGLGDLLRAMSLAMPENPPLRLLLTIKDRQRFKKIQKMLLESGLANRTQMVDVGDEEELLSQADVMVLPYRAAVAAALYPQELLAAAASGCPMITTAIPAWEHLFNLASPGLEMISPGDVSALRRALVTLPRRVDRPKGGPPLLKPPSAHQGMEAVSAIHQRLGGGRFIPGNC
ncbi:MAG: hypothetical protein HW380_2150 [Magnetococcales bacterium]|nr:hypothetical protein [Magnetococcales bacterium]HIJ82592.1 ChbG/HpnK family deacetylase [Magnetococcales bacterium]